MKGPSIPTLDLTDLRQRCAYGDQLYSEGKIPEALKVFAELKVQLRAVGKPSAYVLWTLAICADRTLAAEEALLNIREALTLDPLSPQFLHSHRVIVERMRKLMVEAEDPAEEWVARFYALLQQANAADDACHAAMVRHELGRGNTKAALARAEALVLLAPASAEAWKALCSAARACGDTERAHEAELFAASCELAGPPYGMPAAEG